MSPPRKTGRRSLGCRRWRRSGGCLLLGSEQIERSARRAPHVGRAHCSHRAASTRDDRTPSRTSHVPDGRHRQDPDRRAQDRALHHLRPLGRRRPGDAAEHRGCAGCVCPHGGQHRGDTHLPGRVAETRPDRLHCRRACQRGDSAIVTPTPVGDGLIHRPHSAVRIGARPLGTPSRRVATTGSERALRVSRWRKPGHAASRRWRGPRWARRRGGSGARRCRDERSYAPVSGPWRLC